MCFESHVVLWPHWPHWGTQNPPLSGCPLNNRCYWASSQMKSDSRERFCAKKRNIFTDITNNFYRSCRKSKVCGSVLDDTSFVFFNQLKILLIRMGRIGWIHHHGILCSLNPSFLGEGRNQSCQKGILDFKLPFLLCLSSSNDTMPFPLFNNF